MISRPHQDWSLEQPLALGLSWVLASAAGGLAAAWLFTLVIPLSRQPFEPRYVLTLSVYSWGVLLAFPQSMVFVFVSRRVAALWLLVSGVGLGAVHASPFLFRDTRGAAPDWFPLILFVAGFVLAYLQFAILTGRPWRSRVPFARAWLTMGTIASGLLCLGWIVLLIRFENEPAGMLIGGLMNGAVYGVITSIPLVRLVGETSRET